MAYFLLNPDIGLLFTADLYSLGVMEYWSNGVLKSLAGTVNRLNVEHRTSNIKRRTSNVQY